MAAKPDGLDAVLDGTPEVGRRAILAFAGVAAIVFLWLSMPRIQEAFWPVLGLQSIPDDRVTRTTGHEVDVVNASYTHEKRWIGARLCWERFSHKNYEAPVDNYDVFLDTKDPRTGVFDSANRSFPEVFDEATGDPVSTDRAPKAGDTRRRLCLVLRSTIAPDQPVRVQQFAHFHGLWNMWEMPPERLPEIVSYAANVAAPTP